MHNNRIIHIAVIDDGINEKFYGTGELEHNIEISPELEVRDRACYDSYSPGHGITCVAIMRIIFNSLKYYDQSCKLFDHSTSM